MDVDMPAKRKHDSADGPAPGKRLNLLLHGRSDGSTDPPRYCGICAKWYRSSTVYSEHFSGPSHTKRSHEILAACREAKDHEAKVHYGKSQDNLFYQLSGIRGWDVREVYTILCDAEEALGHRPTYHELQRYVRDLPTAEISQT